MKAYEDGGPVAVTVRNYGADASLFEPQGKLTLPKDIRSCDIFMTNPRKLPEDIEAYWTAYVFGFDEQDNEHNIKIVSESFNAIKDVLEHAGLKL